jgi:hypothetical protein
VGNYCPAGASAPLALGAGYFCGSAALGGEGPLFTCTSRARCPAGYHCGGGSAAAREALAAATAAASGPSARAALAEAAATASGTAAAAAEAVARLAVELTAASTAAAAARAAAAAAWGDAAAAAALAAAAASAPPAPPSADFAALTARAAAARAAALLQDGNDAAAAREVVRLGAAVEAAVAAAGAAAAAAVEAAPAPCPAGKFGDVVGESRAVCAGLCAPGFYCSGASTSATAEPCGGEGVYCPRGSGAPRTPRPGFFTAAEDGSADADSVLSRSRELPCPAGSYCVGGVRAPCPAGRFGAAPRLNASSCSGACEQGFYCPAGSVSATERRCGSAAFFCAAGAGAPAPVPPGYYSVDAGDGANYITRVNASTPGALAPLPPPPLPLSSCARAWAAVGEAGAEAAALAALAAPGSPLEDGLEVGVVVGAAGGGATRAAALLCPPGSFCAGGVAAPCPAGRWGGGWGEARPGCSGPCAAGYYCPPGSATPYAARCGNAARFCPEGSAAPLPVAVGAYSTGGWGATGAPGADPAEGGFLPPLACGAEEEPESDLTLFPAPRAAAAALAGPSLRRAEFTGAIDGTALTVTAVAWGVLTPGMHLAGEGVAAGTVVTALAGVVNGGPAIACGSACTGTVSVPQAVPPATAMVAGPTPAQERIVQVYFLDVVARAGALLRAPCGPPAAARAGGPQAEPAAPLRRACTGGGAGGMGGERTRSAQASCPAGSLCREGLRLLCAPGTFNGAENATACAPCPGGSFCPLGAREPTRCEPSRWCPPRAANPVPAQPGWAPTARGDAEEPCDAGAVCFGGKRTPCPAGSFCITRGLAVPTGPCPAGYFCPEGTATPRACGGSHLYCPGASATPRAVRAGYFSLRAPGGAAPPFSPLQSPNVTATGEAPCPPGWFCVAGVARQCPAGTYGGDGALGSPACSGACAAGHFCPPGSVSPTAQRCGDAFLLLVDVAASLPVQAALAADPRLPDTDGIPTTDPSFSAAALRGLYAALQAAGEDAGGGAVFSAPFGGDGGGDAAGGSWAARATIPLRRGAAAAGAGAAAVLGNAPAAQVELALLVGARERSLQVSAVLPPGAVPSAFVLGGDGGGGNVGPPQGVRVALLPGGGANFSATIPWRGGLRLRLPHSAVNVESFAATQRALLQGGPTSVYCPPGSGWPAPVPPGFFGNASGAALAALAAGARAVAAAASGATAPLLVPPLPAPYDPAADVAAAAAANATQDTALPAPPGWYAVLGARHPCPRGSFRVAPGAPSRASCAPCPAGAACPLGAPDPTPCGEGTYAVDGAWACTPCPGGAVPQTPVNGAETAAQGAPGEGADLMGSTPQGGALGGADAPTPRCRTERRCCE